MFLTQSFKHTKTSQEVKSTGYFQFLEQNIETKINKARLKFISMMIVVLYKIKTSIINLL